MIIICGCNTPARLPAAHWCRTLDGEGPEEREQRRTQRPARHTAQETGDTTITIGNLQAVIECFFIVLWS